MGIALLWTAVCLAALAGLYFFFRWVDALLLRAEEKGWIFYRKKQAGGSVSSALGGAIAEMDRLTRPSVEYRIEAENKIVVDDEQGGD